ncbi:hypothetical protein BJ546DRAFT_949202 [Cryomyces antarcticus]|uniref:F-box domain-containing protein n=1 Tax=Cryomyces antarcticus TaxID=329879 RepID=A0ABR0M925_9PEZI|nr:hypothetical protein LTR39_000595 [Cryomyces antarcticus]KAK5020593.1 hypothetical protein LTR60_000380 [Cryomyces antarcticus]KAK5165032.1 hypothetical protein LTR04_001468 [Oleoguttula sp. CCFEE 6159]KAK5295703.1 hypothetical protein LTR16_000813 [Cryomyces antarcticus]
MTEFGGIRGAENNHQRAAEVLMTPSIRSVSVNHLQKLPLELLRLIYAELFNLVPKRIKLLKRPSANGDTPRRNNILGEFTQELAILTVNKTSYGGAVQVFRTGRTAIITKAQFWSGAVEDDFLLGFQAVEVRLNATDAKRAMIDFDFHEALVATFGAEPASRRKVVLNIKCIGPWRWQLADLPNVELVEHEPLASFTRVQGLHCAIDHSLHNLCLDPEHELPHLPFVDRQGSRQHTSDEWLHHLCAAWGLFGRAAQDACLEHSPSKVHGILGFPKTSAHVTYIFEMLTQKR